MIPSRLLPALLALAVPLSVLSCDADPNPDPFTQADFPLCETSGMRLVGTIDDTSIDTTLAPRKLLDELRRIVSKGPSPARRFAQAQAAGSECRETTP